MKKRSSGLLYLFGGSEDMVIAPSIIPRQKALIVAPYKEIVLPTGHGLIQTQTDTVISEILMYFKRN